MIELRKIASSEFKIRNKLRGELIYCLSSDKKIGNLKFFDFFHESPGANANYYTCLHGGFATESSYYSLNIFSDYVLTERKVKSEMSDKHWELYNLKMHENVRKLLGFIKPSYNRGLSSGWVCAKVECNIDKETLKGSVYFSYKTLLSMIKHNIHQFNNKDRRLKIPISFPVDIGMHTLPLSTLSMLKPGTLIIPSQQNFSPDGKGVIFFDQLRVAGVIDSTKKGVFIVDDIVVNGI